MAFVGPGIRVGFWDQTKTPWTGGPFKPMGIYEGPILGDVIVGSKFNVELMEGTFQFSVGVLFRPDLGKRQRLETILIIDKYVKEIWDYEGWDRLGEVAV